MENKHNLTVLIPALNEERQIADVIAVVRQQAPNVEIIVIDDGSIDATIERAEAAGARVFTSTLLGKGASMEDGLNLVQTPWVLYLDADLGGLRSDLIERMTAPLAEGSADLVKARFSRSGGRVTELTAKPLLRVFFPELAHFVQPLGGIIAGTTTLLRTLSFDDDYGVDVGILIDAHLKGARVVEVEIGEVINDSQPLDRLSLMAQQVSRAIMHRAKASNRFSFEQFLELEEIERQARGTFERVARRLASARKVALFDMDGTLIEGRFVEAMAKHSGREAELARWLDRHDIDASTRGDSIAQVFKFVHQREFVRVARELPLREDAVDAIKRLRRDGWLVGVVSDSYFIAADIVRRRVFADFAIAHFMTFGNEISSGKVRINPAFRHGDSPSPELVSKANVLRHLRDQARPGNLFIAAIGDNLNDVPMLAGADAGFTIAPKHEELRRGPWREVQRLGEVSDALLGEATT
ncbi:HAD-IB family phosphatase [Paucibacter sp. PLA-PC-4]|uniref:HAD-IB family phosphatase n=1 Tax=Paucibacter sp. PLA-PC-4 TaxID=2993655 RepID=UPI00224A4B08|nr:HAD-IB family phosphatase [Paucibacter sp. PLA-PC-4]MCX2863969.1 HAD-IB family phosphatase [Paucibacter sp. PLA-PC-4]